MNCSSLLVIVQVIQRRRKCWRILRSSRDIAGLGSIAIYDFWRFARSRNRPFRFPIVNSYNIHTIFIQENHNMNPSRQPHLSTFKLSLIAMGFAALAACDTGPAVITSARPFNSSDQSGPALHSKPGYSNLLYSQSDFLLTILLS